MKINDKVVEILKENKIPLGDGICYLISVFYGFKPSYIPLEFKLRMNETRIVVPAEKGTGMQWNLPLYEESLTAFGWVKDEFVPLFKEKNSDKGGHVREATARLKKMFAENPEIRKDDVIQATKNYLLATEAGYIRFPHYFVSKDKGVNKTSDLLTWVDRLIEERTMSAGRSGMATRMQ